MNGDTEDAADAEEDESDQDDDGGVPPQIVTELVVRCKLDQSSSKESPGEEAFLGRRHPRLGIVDEH